MSNLRLASFQARLAKYDALMKQSEDLHLQIEHNQAQLTAALKVDLQGLSKPDGGELWSSLDKRQRLMLAQWLEAGQHNNGECQ